MKQSTKMKLRITYYRALLFLIGFNLEMARRGYNYETTFKLEQAKRKVETELRRLLRNQSSVQLANQFMRRLENKP